MQMQLYRKNDKNETHENKIYRLNQKWLIESELWLAFMIVVELASIYKLASLNDRRLNMQSKMGLTKDQVKNIEEELECN